MINFNILTEILDKSISTGHEWAAIYNELSGKVEYIEGSEDHVDIWASSYVYDGTYLLVHTHIGEGTFSPQDLDHFLYWKNLRCMIVIQTKDSCYDIIIKTPSTITPRKRLCGNIINHFYSVFNQSYGREDKRWNDSLELTVLDYSKRYHFIYKQNLKIDNR